MNKVNDPRGQVNTPDSAFYPDHLDIGQIAASGQCFRMRRLSDGNWLIPSGDRCIRSDELFRQFAVIKGSGSPVSSHCRDLNTAEDLLYWHTYFDLDRDYSAIEAAIRSSEDSHLIEAFEQGSGVRILKQDLWETIISFMISQNNNIKRIAGSIEKLCKLAGRNTASATNAEAGSVYAFPHPEDLDPSVFDDASLGLGYRAGFIRDMFIYTAEHPEWLSELKKAPYEDARKLLMSRKGIGPKVSDCICLFALSHVDAWPVDTHVKQLVARYYPDGFDFERYRGYAGIIQQYLFYYEIKK